MSIPCCQVCREGTVFIATKSYVTYMIAAILLGGPACALALSAVYEAHAHAVASERSLGLTRDSVATRMQSLYLLLLVVIIGACALVVETATPAELLMYGGGVHGALHYIFWPADYFQNSTLTWLSPLSAMMLCEWCATLLLGNLIAVRGGHQSNEGITGTLVDEVVGTKYDMAVRIVIINVLAYPAPQLGLGFYLLLEARSLTSQPILACCGKVAPKKVSAEALAAWRSAQKGHLARAANERAAAANASLLAVMH